MLKLPKRKDCNKPTTTIILTSIMDDQRDKRTNKQGRIHSPPTRMGGQGQCSKKNRSHFKKVINRPTDRNEKLKKHEFAIEKITDLKVPLIKKKGYL